MSETDRHPSEGFYSSPWIDRAAHLRDDPDWLAAALEDPAAGYLLMRGERSLVAGTDPPVASVLGPGELPAALDREQALFLGLEDGRPWFALEVPAGEAGELAGEGRFGDLRREGPLMGRRDAGLLAYARGMVTWQRTHRFCGRCGSPTRRDKGGTQRRCTDEECGRIEFPRTDPAVIVRVAHDDRILLGRQASWPPGWLSVLAGFVEPGETLEEVVRREVAEETGVEVTDVRYVASQPWPFPASLMVGFTARARRDRLRIDPDELEEARWLDREELRGALDSGEIRLPPATSISRRLIDDWLQAGVR